MLLLRILKDALQHAAIQLRNLLLLFLLIAAEPMFHALVVQMDQLLLLRVAELLLILMLGATVELRLPLQD